MTSSRVEKNQVTLSIGGDYVELQTEAFLRERKAQNLSKATIRYYTNNLKVFLGYLNDIEIKFIHQITPQNIRDFLLILADRGHNEGGVHGHFRAVRAFLNWYFEETEPDYKNPMDKVKAPRNPVKPIEGVSKDDFEKLISACSKNFFGERDKAILMTLLDTGIRALELCNIDIEDVNFADSSDLPPKNWSKTNVRIGPIRRQKQWQNGRYFQQNRSS